MGYSVNDPIVLYQSSMWLLTTTFLFTPWIPNKSKIWLINLLSETWIFFICNYKIWYCHIKFYNSLVSFWYYLLWKQTLFMVSYFSDHQSSKRLFEKEKTCKLSYKRHWLSYIWKRLQSYSTELLLCFKVRLMYELNQEHIVFSYISTRWRHIMIASL